ncbi:hypothetical protein Q7C36_016889 [Tachysurus vachellii]|uniref:Uncharacterized protein n=1 Tax=Tachysurus vachellii TaxID=175792 RepID=A0AA88M9A3_TACVA|nr:hypothetical protein Q7C36_016889 [Tachysurus vachellii]
MSTCCVRLYRSATPSGREIHKAALRVFSCVSRCIETQSGATAERQCEENGFEKSGVKSDTNGTCYTSVTHDLR